MHPLDIHWIYTLGSLSLVAAFSLLGMIGLSLSAARLTRVVPYLVSVAAGALLGTALGHLLPESVEHFGAGRKLSGLLLAGFCVFFLLEKWMIVRSHRNGHTDTHLHDHAIHPETAPPATFGKQNGSLAANILLGGAIHSFVDGIVIATAWTARPNLGLVATVAVMLHEGPHHVGDVSILIHSGIPVRRAVFLNFLASAPSLAGALLVLLLGQRADGFTAAFLPFTTANFLYIAAATLVPEMQQERGIRQSIIQILLFVGGISLMYLLGNVQE
jgi:zinc and cadmium transporter